MLGYAHVFAGPVERSQWPTLEQLSSRDPYLPYLDDTLRFVDWEIAADEAMVIVPGEDPIYYALERKPGFPVVLFDATDNPYTPDELSELVRRFSTRWILIKQSLQPTFNPVSEFDPTVAQLTENAELVGTRGAYLVYRRASPQR